jgi:hypothetical protein
MHQNAHNTLAELDEAVPETKKVTDFLAGITDSRLSNAKDLILGDPDKLQNFEACQQYLKTLVYNKVTQEKHERQISGIHQDQGKFKDDGGKLKNGGGKRKGGGVIDDGKVVARQYTRAKWFKLTPDQRKRIKDLRAAKRSKNQGTRNASSIQTDDANLHQADDALPPPHPSTSPPTTRNGNPAPPTTTRILKSVQRG